MECMFRALFERDLSRNQMYRHTGTPACQASPPALAGRATRTAISSCSSLCHIRVATRYLQTPTHSLAQVGLVGVLVRLPSETADQRDPPRETDPRPAGHPLPSTWAREPRGWVGWLDG